MIFFYLFDVNSDQGNTSYFWILIGCDVNNELANTVTQL